MFMPAASVSDRLAAAYPLREKPFYAPRRPRADVASAPVGLAAFLQVPEHQGIALAALEAQPEIGEGGLAPPVTLVELDQHGHAPLSVLFHVARLARLADVEEIDV